MSIRVVGPGFDEDTGPILRFEMYDKTGTVRDASTVAFVCDITDEADTLLASVPGTIIDPNVEADGLIDVMLPGTVVDWAGAGKQLVFKPRVYVATAPGGAAATNLLVNPSFDSGTVIATSWTLVGAQTATWVVDNDDPAPATIFGKYQSVYHAALGQPDYIQQSPSVSLVAGDRLSVGCWHRCKGGAGEGASNTHAIFFRQASGSNQFVQFRVGDQEWYFVTGSLVANQSDSTATFGLDGRGTTLVNRYDNAFFFKGTWRIINVPPIRYKVGGRQKAYRGSTSPLGKNFTGEVGVFVDGDADGFPDQWSNGAASVTSSLDYDPDEIYSTTPTLPAAWKFVLTGAANQRVWFIKRGAFDAGEIWNLTVYYKLDAGATGTPGAGTFGPTLRTLDFDGAVETAVGTNFDTGQTTYATRVATLTLTADHNALMGEINLDGVTGTLRIGLVTLTQT